MMDRNSANPSASFLICSGPSSTKWGTRASAISFRPSFKIFRPLSVMATRTARASSGSARRST